MKKMTKIVLFNFSIATVMSSCNLATNSEQVLSLASKSSNSQSSGTDTSSTAWDQPITSSKITCNSTTPDPTSSIQRLTKRQLTNSVNSFLTEIDSALVSDSKLVSLLASIPSDIISYKENSLLITQQIVNIHFDIFYRVGELVAGSTTAQNYLVGNNGCLAASTITSTCQSTFVKNIGRLVYRRNLETTEVNNLVAFFC